VLRMLAAEGPDLHLWIPIPVKPSERALCGAPGPAEPGTGSLCQACWEMVSGAIGSAFAGRERALRSPENLDEEREV
jgi:hypothetical protein